MVKDSACTAGEAEGAGSIPRLGRSPGGGNSNPLQYSCLENPMDRGAWRTTVQAVIESGMTEHISLIFGGIAFQSLVSSAVGN